MTRIAARSTTAVAAFVLAVLAGCAVTGPADTGPDLTGGRTWELYTAREGAMARYRIDPDGTLHFGGGRDAMGGRFSWSGPLTAAELDELVELIDEASWFDGPEPVGDDSGRTWALSERMGMKVRRVSVEGDTEKLREVYDLLSTASRRRYGDFLESMPKAGKQ